MSEIAQLTLLTLPGTIRWLPDTQIVETDFVAAIKPDGQEPIYHVGVGPNHKLRPVDVSLPTARAARLVLLFRKLYSPARDTSQYDCLSGVDFICSQADNVVCRRRCYESIPAAADNLAPGEPHIILSDNEVIHGLLATDSSHGVHVAGENSALAYNLASDITKVWPGNLMRVITARPLD